MQGCKREPAQPQPETELPTMIDTNFPALTDTNTVVPPPDTNAVTMPSVPNTTPVPPPQPTEYTIQKNDSFYSIGKKYQVSMKAIQEANPNVNPTKLQIGQKIVIPPPTTSPTTGGTTPVGGLPLTESGTSQTYTVKSGDTLTKIATQHGTTISALREANNLRTDRIKVGEKLIIPAKASAPPSPAPVESYPAPAPAPVSPAPGTAPTPSGAPPA